MPVAERLRAHVRAPASRQRALGPALTLVAILAAETFGHIFPLPSNISGAMLVLGLAPTAYSGLKGGPRVAILSTAMLALYGLHYVAPHDTLVLLTTEGWMAFATLAILGAAMSYPMTRIKLREDRLRADLASRAKDLEERYRELVEANEALEAFGYVVSHDLKEPVRAVENYLDAARQDWPSPQGKTYVEEAYLANLRLTRLLQGLLSYSRTSSLVASPRPVDVEAVLESDTCTSQYRAKLQARTAQLHVEPPLPRVLGDEVILAQLLGNLILNSVRHNPKPTPHVVIRPLPAPEGRAHIVIADDGPGFPQDVIHRFESLRRNRPATIKGGFGLVIAQRAAQRLGGRMRLVNPPTGGAEVHLDLPAAPEASPGPLARPRAS